MARSGLEDISNIKDPLLTYNFGLIIPNIPGGGNGLQLTLRCQSTVIPGMNIEPALLGLRGMELQYAGRHTYSHTLPVTYVEARDMITRQSMLRWMYFARDFRNNQGNFKAEYSTSADIELYDDKGTVIRTIRLFGVFPLGVDDLGLESSGSTIAAFSCNLSYDYFRDIEDL